MADADQRDLLPRLAVPTLLIWGERDARSPLSVARQFEQRGAHALAANVCGEVEEYRELDDERIVVLLRIAGRGKTSGWSSEQSGPGAPTSSRSAAGR